MPKANSETCLTVKVITDDTFRAHEGFDLARFEGGAVPASELPTFRVAKKQPFIKFKAQLAKELGYHADRFRLWVVSKRDDETGAPWRPKEVVPENEPKMKIVTVHRKVANQAPELRLYLEVLSQGQRASLTKHKEARILIFVKYFDFTHQTLTGLGHFVVKQGQKVKDIVPQINRHLKIGDLTKLDLYEEIGRGSHCPINTDKTFLESRMGSGDIICCQTNLTLERNSLHAREIEFYCHKFLQFCNFFDNEILVHFEPRYSLPTAGGFDLLLSPDMSFATMAARVGHQLGQKPSDLRFSYSSHQGEFQEVVQPVASKVMDVLGCLSAENYPKVLLYFEYTKNENYKAIEVKRDVEAPRIGAPNRENACQSADTSVRVVPANTQQQNAFTGERTLENTQNIPQNSSLKLFERCPEAPLDLHEPPLDFDVSLVRRPLNRDDLKALVGTPAPEVEPIILFKCAENALAHCLKTVVDLFDTLPPADLADLEMRQAAVTKINEIALNLRNECIVPTRAVSRPPKRKLLGGASDTLSAPVASSSRATRLSEGSEHQPKRPRHSGTITVSD